MGNYHLKLPINQIIEGDSLEILKKFPDESIDLVLTDPPYGTKTNQRGDSFMIGEFSNILPLVLPEIYRVLKPNGAFYCFTSWTQMSEWLLRFQQYFKLQNLLIWDKKRHSGCYSPSSWQFTWEGIFFGIKGKRKIRKYQKDVLISEEKGKRIAMQKPVDIVKKLIEASSDEGMVILDPFIGSGTTAVACKRLKRNFIGIDISKKYCELARQRIKIQPEPLL